MKPQQYNKKAISRRLSQIMQQLVKVEKSVKKSVITFDGGKVHKQRLLKENKALQRTVKELQTKLKKL